MVTGYFSWQYFLWFFSLKSSADTSGEYVKVSFLLKLLCFRPSLVNLFSRALLGRLFSLCLPVGFCLPLAALWTCAVIRSELVTERTLGMSSSRGRYFEASGVAASNSSGLDPSWEDRNRVERARDFPVQCLVIGHLTDSLGWMGQAAHNVNTDVIKGANNPPPNSHLHSVPLFCLKNNYRNTNIHTHMLHFWSLDSQPVGETILLSLRGQHVTVITV